MSGARGPGTPPGRFTVFLDRDGVFNPNPRIYIRRWGAYRFLPGARDAFARLNRSDVQTCLATNQHFTHPLLNTRRSVLHFHERFRAALAQAGGRLDHVEACTGLPILPDRRRKPRPGMLEDGAAALGGVDKARAVMVGDKPKDAQAAAAFGIPCILLATTYPASRLEAEARRKGIPYAAIAPDLGAAVELILSWLPSEA
jgi:D-glycero-D-manno-heptose 1,7-bisphosphate phosphatase